MAAKFQLVSDYQPAGDQPKAIDKLVDGLPRRQGRSRCCSGPPAPARRSPPPTSSPRSASRRSSWPTTRRSPPSSTRSSRASSRTTPSTTSSATTTTTSPRPTSRSATSTSRKTPSINENIDRLRLAATAALVSREDVIIVASVSCIYGLGSPSDYKRMMVYLPKGEVDRPRQPAAAARRHPVPAERHRLRARQVPRPRRHHRGLAGVRGSRPTASSCSATRSSALASSTRVSGETLKALDELYVYPAKHFVTPEDRVREADRGHRGRNWTSGWSSSRPRASCWRPSG